MGCDIHLYTEIKDHRNGKFDWRNADHWKLNPYWDGTDEEREYTIAELFGDRHYELFGVLANVRSRSEKNPPISEPRGLPEDVSPIIQKESDRWGEDGHSHSYLTYRELKEYADKHPGVTYSGFISPEAAKALDEKGTRPSEWCGWTSNESWVEREWQAPFEALNRLVRNMEERMREEMWIWHDQPIPEDKWDNFRIVFWFDN